MDTSFAITTTTEVLNDLLSHMGISGARVEYEDSITKGHVFNIFAPNSRLLIGRQGAHLHSLELIAHQLVSKKLGHGQMFRFTLDVDDYMRKREWYLKETAKQAAEQVKRVGKPLALEPMPNYERRYVHAYLQEHFPDLLSDSTGRDPYRKIVIRNRRRS